MLAIHLNRLGCFVARARAHVCVGEQNKKNGNLIAKTKHFYLLNTTFTLITVFPAARSGTAGVRLRCFGAPRALLVRNVMQRNERSSLCGVAVGCTL